MKISDSHKCICKRKISRKKMEKEIRQTNQQKYYIYNGHYMFPSSRKNYCKNSNYTYTLITMPMQLNFLNTYLEFMLH